MFTLVSLSDLSPNIIWSIAVKQLGFAVTSHDKDKPRVEVRNWCMAGGREPEASRALNSSLGLESSLPWSCISLCIACTHTNISDATLHLEIRGAAACAVSVCRLLLCMF